MISVARKVLRTNSQVLEDECVLLRAKLQVVARTDALEALLTAAVEAIWSLTESKRPSQQAKDKARDIANILASGIIDSKKIPEKKAAPN